MLFYNLAIYFYAFCVRVVSLFLPKARLMLKGRRSWEQNLAAKISKNDKWLWFHCASLGEFEDGIVLLEKIKTTYTDHKILLTFFSPSGFEKQKYCPAADYVCYLPLDTPANAKAFAGMVNPRAAFIITNDIWVNMITKLADKGVPVFHVSISVNAQSNFFKFPVKHIYKKAFARFTCMFVQNNTTAHLLKKHFALTNLVVTGDTRADRTEQITRQQIDLPGITQFVAGSFCVIGGSLLPKDEELFLAAISALKHKAVKWVVVPHEINKQYIDAQVALASDLMISYSRLAEMKPSHKVLWIDNVGMLSRLYKYGSIAFIGGGFNPIGIHNIQEPAAFGCPVAFGPNYRSYKEAEDLLVLNGAGVIHNTAELITYIENFSTNPQLLAQTQNSNKNYIASTTGASGRIMKLLDERRYLA